MRNGYAAVGLLFVVTSSIIIHAYFQKKQFFPVVVYLTKHKLFFAIILSQCLTILILLTKALGWIFFGSIHRTELDTILSRAWLTIFDMCLLFAFFQDEINTKFLFMFTVIIFVKGFHWLLEGRIEQMERTPVISTSFHVRTISFMVLLASMDIFNIIWFYWGADQNLASLSIGAEFYICFFELISTIMHYALQIINSMHNTPWDQKSLYMLYVDVVVGIIRLFFYWEFASALWRHHPFPLFIIRPIYLNLRFIKKTLIDLFMSRRAIRLMNTVFRDVTLADLTASNDAVCIICREEMQPPADATTEIAPGTIKRLPCGHIFHAACLRTWFQRQQTCPTCRLNVLRQYARVQQEAGQPAHNLAQGQGQQSQQRRRVSGRINTQHTSRREASENPVQQSPPHPPNAATILPPFAYNLGPQLGQTSGSTASMYFTPPIIIPGDQFFPGLTSPMPTPPTDLAETNVTERELRASVEARITALNHIKVLLDAAIIQMNAYVAATTAATMPTPPTTEVQETPSQSSNSKNGNSDGSRETSPETKEPIAPTQIDEITVLRQRRLEKLANPTKDSPQDASNSPETDSQVSHE